MDCIGCGSTAVAERPDLTAQGYHRFRCRDCGKQFNERSDGVLNRASLPSDIIAFVVFCRLRYRLTLRDLSEIMLLRGFIVSHESIRRWEAKLLPVMGEALRKRRHGTGRNSGQSWYVDETYLKVQGRWCYLYRAIDRDGNLIDTMLSPTRDMKAARRFFRSARSVAGFVPDRVTTDGQNFDPLLMPAKFFISLRDQRIHTEVTDQQLNSIRLSHLNPPGWSRIGCTAQPISISGPFIVTGMAIMARRKVLHGDHRVGSGLLTSIRNAPLLSKTVGLAGP